MPVDVLIRLSHYFNVSTDYILGLSDVKRNLNQQMLVEKTLDNYYNFVEVYKELDERDRKLVWGLMDSMRDLKKKEKSKNEGGSSSI